MESRTYILAHDQARQRAVQDVLTTPAGWAVKVSEPTRKEIQSAKFHALCGDVAKSGFQWLGQPRTKNQWKILFISGHTIVTGGGAEIVPGLEGEFLNLRESSASMGIRRAASLIEYTMAFCISNNIPLTRYE